MGNYRFRLSDMIPNAWFYKLKDMGKTRKPNHSRPINKKPSFSSQDSRKSSYRNRGSKAFDVRHVQFPGEKPRSNSPNKREKKKAPPSVSADFVFQESGMPVWLKPQMVRAEEYCSTASPELNFLVASPSDEFECFDASVAAQLSVDGGLESWSSSCSWNIRSSATDIILDMKEPYCRVKKTEQAVKFELISKPDLPPILTAMPIKQASRKESHNSKSSQDEITEEGSRAGAESGSRTSATRKSMSRSGSVKIRGSWARLASKKRGSDGRKSTKNDKKGPIHSRSVAIVKASFDPENDFKNSMMEMIAENKIKKSRDLEQLLACYLSLNTDQYHDVIIKAFEQIWFNMSELHP